MASLSLQCPQCNRPVTVDAGSAGTRVKCPHCDKAFLAPGLSATTSDDADDWLSLDSDPIPSRPVVAKPTSPPAVPKPAGSKPRPIHPNPARPGPSREPKAGKPASPRRSSETAPRLTEAEEALLSQYADDDFTSRVESPPKPASKSRSGRPPDLSKPGTGSDPFTADLGEDAFGGLGEMDLQDLADLQQPLPAKAKPVEPEYEQEYRLKCNVCDSLLYVKAEQAGSTIKCPNCYSPLKVPPAPKVKKKQKLELDQVETFAFEKQVEGEKKRVDPFRKSAEQLLEEAAREEVESPPDNSDVPNLVEWLKGVFGIFLDPGVLVHWLVLSVCASVPAAVAISTGNKIAVVGLFVAGFFLGAVVVSCGFAILQSVANDEKTVSDWPVFDFFAWMGPLFVAFSAVGFSMVPVWFLSQWLLGPGLFALALTMLSLYTLFPFVLLSMLDMNSPFTPFSAEVARSVTNSHEAWGGLYFSAGLLFFGLFLIYAAGSTMAAPVAAVLAIFSTIAVAFIYFAMIGRLAYSIGQEIAEPEFEKKSDS
ncbi:hypothetical protein [Novipirellula artificiosorum]|uniref:Uncharacterized protein n=1 Tax=Novipirellula artificiosorum TaxID=2528016 RepID=A0A5C6E545_9BACT|nr:hypothetical protein [Novipirellula artificiosorum]TWU42546.1 hypothetical protein Poly41_08430 [Novipirellula artificiosorum]